MSIKNIVIACQGGGSHAAYTAGALPALLPRFENAAIARAGGRDGALQRDADEHLNLAGISGTSGGAISALLAWYGYLRSGPDEAQARLAAFWDANCARQPGETMLNEATQWLGRSSNIDLKLSPYLSPMREFGDLVNHSWPSMAAWWPPFEAWIRGSYFQLRETVAAHVNFGLVGAIGDFCSIPQDVKRYQAYTLEARMRAGQRGNKADEAAILTKRRAVEDRLRRKIAATAQLVAWLGKGELAPGCPLRAAFDGWQAPPLVFETAALDALAEAVRQVSYTIPHLLIGAVDVDSGAFLAFSSERAPEEAGVTLDAVAASACLPWVFRAQAVETIDPDTEQRRVTACWDGLFSQNPPIRNFLANAGDAAKKPDGIWILQINQDRSDFSKRIQDEHDSYRYGGELWHRRDTLAGNLSLNQEIAFIEAVNRRLDDPDQGARPRDRPIEVARIVMDCEAVGASAGRTLGIFSKFDRAPWLKEALSEHGRTQATRFLALRSDHDRLCGELAQALEQIGARPSRGAQQMAQRHSGRLFGGMLSPDVLTIDRAPGPPRAGEPQAELTWHVSDAVVDGRVVRIKGRTGFIAEGDGWRLGETRLSDVRHKEVVAVPAPLPSDTLVVEERVPEGGERRRGADGLAQTLH